MESRKLGPFALPLLLLVLSVLINYIDRGNLSIAAPLLKDELGLSASQLGILFSAFFWTYTVMLFVCGWFIDRFDVNRVLALGFLLWSLAQWSYHCRDEVRAGGRDPWRGSPYGKLWLASSSHRNWTNKPRLATCMGQVDAAHHSLRSSRSLPPCDRHLTTAFILGHCR